MCKGKEKSEEIKSIEPSEEIMDPELEEDTEEEFIEVSEDDEYISEAESEQENANNHEKRAEPIWAPIRLSISQPARNLEQIIEEFSELNAEAVISLAFKQFFLDHPSSPSPDKTSYTRTEEINRFPRENVQIPCGNNLLITGRTPRQVTLDFTNVYPDDIALIIPKSHLDSPTLLRFVEGTNGELKVHHGIKIGISFDTIIARIQSATLDLRHIIKIIMENSSSDEE